VIFASVGSMLPFERLVQAVDDWAGANLDQDVYIQIGEGKYQPRHAPFARIMTQSEYRERLRGCDLFVAHVGMGSILQGLEEKKQMLLLPRVMKLGEHTTDHQFHTAERFGHLDGIRIVQDVVALQQQMSLLLQTPLTPGAGISNDASPELISGITAFLNAARRR
jgi:UDP-N-acetylglucosamine transferase subunit ALG13